MLAGNLASTMSIRRRPLTLLLVILAAFAAVLVLPGCGDDIPKAEEFKTVADYFPVKLGDRS
ncbi:MAG: hypothetical protein WCO84_09525, partial [bacterium]